MEKEIKQDKIKVIFVDDHDSVRQGFVNVISALEDIRVIADFGTLGDFFQSLPDLDPDVVVMDIQMKDGDGIESTTRIKEDNPSIEVIILSMLDDEDSILRAIEAGASGYFLKDATLSEIAEAIRTVYKGGALFYPKVTRKILEYISQGAKSQGIGAPGSACILDEKEIHLMQMVSAGSTNKEIADKTGDKESNVKAKLREIYHKLEARDRASAVFKAVKKGII